MKLYDDLVWRGLIKDVANDNLEEVLNGEPITFYWGTDPTADSLHIGHYSSLVTAKRLAKYGHHPILLCGGATGRIGDPRPTAEREIISNETVSKNIIAIKNQIDKLFNGQAEIVDNYTWTKDYTYLDFLRDIGKYINVNYMLNKDIISRRLETGITYAEFSYTLLQGYDFLHLYKEKNCIMQVEGSDQWGNITTGIELIRKILGKEAYGFTMPLILDKFGNKFGKSEGNALWLDKEKTSPYEIYQYLLNSDDSKVYEYLKVFTFLSKEEIEEVMQKQNECPEKRIAQKTLAYEVVKDIHSKEDAEHAIKVSEALFTGNVKELTDKEIEMVFKGMPSIESNEDTIINIMVNNNIASSRREAREFLSNNAITIDGEIISDENHIITNNKKNHIIRRGKKKYYLIKIN
ncbi:MAG: tyrosine--tRNA ligase [Firmicutes bacterium]|nr:tyrosine--tRNA ligase [Bacillota bacterium]MDY5336299.1 tyrosine--tRNA ligase [Bacilli bacterium]OLA35187.1 MAG: tyrosine--tRNA ligase [Firmicutes bacterium CAG:321_26_22]